MERTLGSIAYDAYDTSLPFDVSWQAVADAVVAENEARRWKAIEGAPRNRQYILAYSPERKMSFQVRWDHGWGYWQMMEGGQCTMEFTLWTPIPAPPKEVA